MTLRLLAASLAVALLMGLAGQPIRVRIRPTERGGCPDNPGKADESQSKGADNKTDETDGKGKPRRPRLRSSLRKQPSAAAASGVSKPFMSEFRGPSRRLGLRGGGPCPGPRAK